MNCEKQADLKENLLAMDEVLVVAAQSKDPGVADLAKNLLELYPNVFFKCRDIQYGGMVEADGDVPGLLAVVINKYEIGYSKNSTREVLFNRYMPVKKIIHEVIHVLDIRSKVYHRPNAEQECMTEKRALQLMVAALQERQLLEKFNAGKVLIVPSYQSTGQCIMDSVTEPLRELGFGSFGSSRFTVVNAESKK